MHITCNNTCGLIAVSEQKVTGSGDMQGLNAVDIVLMTIKIIMTNLRKRLAFHKVKNYSSTQTHF